MMQPLPTRKAEAWRYADLAALAEVWPAGVVSETRVVPAGDSQRLVLASAATPVAVRDLRIELEAGARLDLRLLLAGHRYGRIAIDATLAEGAHLELGGVMLGGDASTQEIVCVAHHAKPGATSNQIIRAVLAGKATGSYLGKIVVERGADKTDAVQSAKAMLLDRTATANLKPELEIYADDVKCAHGATVGELDQMQQFYMAARGLPPAEAKRLLLAAFVADALAGDAELEARATAALEGLLCA
jgi:Fe-S cluster assembly protein SufD